MIWVFAVSFVKMVKSILLNFGVVYCCEILILEILFFQCCLAALIQALSGIGGQRAVGL